MTWLRFYYFTFLFHYRNKPKSWAGAFRSLLLLQLSFSWAILSLWLLDPGFWALGSITQPLIIVVNLITLIFLYRYLLHKGRSEAIVSEFKDHPINTDKNRQLCWALWIGSFFLFLTSALLL